MTTRDLAITAQEPKEVILAGRAAAKELTGIVSSRDKKLVLAGKQYLFFEDWQTIGKFYGVTAKVTSTEELRDNDNLIGFLAHATAVAGSNEISAADGECTRDEPNWREKPRFQLRSMAQTRACAKALRNCLGWVAVLAGYEATPAEEMPSRITKNQKVAKPTKSAKAPQTKIKPREEWDKVTSDQVPDYPKLEPIIWNLCKIQPMEMYKELGVSSRNDMTIPAWEAFHQLKERFAPADLPDEEENPPPLEVDKI